MGADDGAEVSTTAGSAVGFEVGLILGMSGL